MFSDFPLATRACLLSYLLQEWCDVPSEAECMVHNLSVDSRTIAQGTLFIALRGQTIDASQFISSAVKQGAVAVLFESDIADLTWHEDTQVPIFHLPNLRQAYGHIAAKYYDYPAKKLYIVGVTGTNGKTSFTYLLANLLQNLGQRCGLLGTLGVGDLENLQKTLNTTPDALTIQHCLAHLLHQGFDTIAMEVSSHALDQYRVNGVEFDIAVFTNLSQDHLDYHQDMQQYALAKLALFERYQPEYAVINADDMTGQAFIRQLWSLQSVYAYSSQGKTAEQLLTQGQIPIVSAHDTHFNRSGLQARLQTPWGGGVLTSTYIGQFSIDNLLAVITCLSIMGHRLDGILEQIPHLPTVPGRMQQFNLVGQAMIIVDYAHTPDALEKILQTLHAYEYDKLWCIFGCGGSRDRGKRKMMGAIAARYADHIVLTQDNSRNEQAEAIIKDILQGIPRSLEPKIEPDRARAIAHVISSAGRNDIVLIAGKGHEDYQECAGICHYFSDVDEVQKLLKMK